MTVETGLLMEKNSRWIMEEALLQGNYTPSREFSTKYRVVSRENLRFQKLQNIK